jgi:hypothetical protein
MGGLSARQKFCQGKGHTSKLHGDVSTEMRRRRAQSAMQAGVQAGRQEGMLVPTQTGGPA